MCRHPSKKVILTKGHAEISLEVNMSDKVHVYSHIFLKISVISVTDIKTLQFDGFFIIK